MTNLVGRSIPESFINIAHKISHNSRVGKMSMSCILPFLLTYPRNSDFNSNEDHTTFHHKHQKQEEQYLC